MMEAEDLQGQSHRMDPEQEGRSSVRHRVRLSPGAVAQMWGESATGIRKEMLSSPSAHGLTAPHTLELSTQHPLKAPSSSSSQP